MGVTITYPDYLGMAQEAGYRAAAEASAAPYSLGVAPSDLASQLGAPARMQAILDHHWGMGWLRYTSSEA